MNGAQLLRQLADRAGRPFGVHLQVADRCNHACRHCYQVQGLKGELGAGELCTIIDGIAESGAITLNVSGGEATLRPDLLEILRHARGRGLAVRLYTNAFLVDDELARKLADIGLLEVHVSLYSASASEHDAVTRVPGSFVRTMTGIRALRAVGMRVVLKTPATSLSLGGAAEVRAIADDLGCVHHPTNDLTAREDGSEEPWEVRATPAALLAHGRLAPWEPSAVEEEDRRTKLGFAPCGVGRSGLVVLPDGRLQPCTDTPEIAADLRTTPFADALRADVLRLFEGLHWSKVHGCRDCDLLTACQRCHATALHEGGDYLGPYASACERARARYSAAAGPLDLREPGAECAPGRDPNIGPYRIAARGVLEPIADVRTDEDDRIAAAFPWVRRAAAAPALVPLRTRATRRKHEDTTSISAGVPLPERP